MLEWTKFLLRVFQRGRAQAPPNLLYLGAIPLRSFRDPSRSSAVIWSRASTQGSAASAAIRSSWILPLRPVTWPILPANLALRSQCNSALILAC